MRKTEVKKQYLVLKNQKTMTIVTVMKMMKMIGIKLFNIIVVC